MLAVLVLILAVALVLCLLRDATSRFIAVAVLAFPLLFVLSPATWYWGRGALRGLHRDLRRSPWPSAAPRWADDWPAGRAAVGRVALAVVVTGIVVVGIVDFSRTVTPVSSYASNWRYPNGPAFHTVDVLEATASATATPTTGWPTRSRC